MSKKNCNNFRKKQLSSSHSQDQWYCNIYIMIIICFFAWVSYIFNMHSQWKFIGLKVYNVRYTKIKSSEIIVYSDFLRISIDVILERQPMGGNALCHCDQLVELYKLVYVSLKTGPKDDWPFKRRSLAIELWNVSNRLGIIGPFQG
jgi:hypothetical protein